MGKDSKKIKLPADYYAIIVLLCLGTIFLFGSILAGEFSFINIASLIVLIYLLVLADKRKKIFVNLFLYYLYALVFVDLVTSSPIFLWRLIIAIFFTLYLKIPKNTYSVFCN